MKHFVMALALFIGFAHADVPEILARRSTCSNLQAELAKYGSLTVVKSFLGIKDRTQVSVKADCYADGKTFAAYFKTKDNKSCKVGQYCDYFTSSAGDWTHTSYTSGTGYDYGSTYDSGSSSSSGSNYNPPSSSYEGPRYNPPSSGSHGPRYCPTCSL